MNEPLSHGVFAVIAAMTAVTAFSRFAGFWMMGRVTLTPRIMRMLEALPGSVVAALILPVILKEGFSAADRHGRGGAHDDLAAQRVPGAGLRDCDHRRDARDGVVS